MKSRGRSGTPLNTAVDPSFLTVGKDQATELLPMMHGREDLRFSFMLQLAACSNVAHMFHFFRPQIVRDGVERIGLGFFFFFFFGS